MDTQQLTARKSIDDIVASGAEDARHMTKTLGLTSITAMGIGAIIGAGIFVLTGTASSPRCCRCAAPATPTPMRRLANCLPG